MLGLLAGGHRRLARKRRHRSGFRALPRRYRRPDARGGLRAGGARRDGATVELAGPPRPARRLAYRRGHRPRRVHGGGARQHVHQPDGRGTTCASPRRRVERNPEAARALDVDHRGGRGVAGRGRRGSRSHRRRTRRASAVRGVHHAARVGLHRRHRLSAAAARAVCAAVPGPGDQAGRPGAGHALAGPRLHRRSRRPATSPTTSRAPCATPRCRRARRR